MNWRDRIESDPEILHGRLRLRGTGIPVSVVLDNLAAHVDVQEVLASYPSLSPEDVRACVAWAAECSHVADQVPACEGIVGTGIGAQAAVAKKATGFKEFLRSMPNIGDDADFERPLDHGRAEIEWDT